MVENDMDKYWFPALIVSTIVSLLITTILGFIVGVCIWEAKKEFIDKSFTYELVSLNNYKTKKTTGSANHFILVGSASFEFSDQMYYQYFVRRSRGIRYEKTPMENRDFYIEETNENIAYLKEYGRHMIIKDPFWLKMVNPLYQESDIIGPVKIGYRVAHIPKGTILRDFDINLNK